MTEAPEPRLDDRCAFEVAEAVIRTIGASDPARPDEEEVIRAVVEAEGPGSAGYVNAITRSRHSVFYQQL